MIIGNSKVAIEAIEQYDSIVIFHHIRPDGDCLGSQAGLAELIRTNYPNKKVYTVGNSQHTFDFMNYKFNKYEEIDFTNSLAIVVDASSGDRIECAELLYENKTTAKLRIDHHPNDADIKYDYNWIDEHYVAAAEMIAQIAKDAGWKVTEKAAAHVYLGINTDSGRFLYPDTSARTHDLVSFLMREGNFHPKNILAELGKRSLRDIQFVGKILSGFEKKGRVLYYKITTEIMNEFGMNSLEAAIFVNELANIDDNRCWAFFIQLEDGKVRGRLRSNGPLVNVVAREFNGGGHDNAAGITLDSWTQVDLVLDKLNEAIIEFEK
ncbi:bifunctional oligoribonuclease/PAP phosphatase NrnA [Mycoplasma anatis]|uniref:Bifunctional oligoribonuclease/PAP phosphatase NrnA n=1 Tax=Mycoplasmopsis anatis TaxID=171279 RepID=A0A9Q3L787_9BACT|nr:bifunctional oligoribonuclease/PAP phosphatase NrnA [Mycoplasmopsis anatis]MBW0595847.1 bifunctional oligoribonuclease/PAP phosphatase NrnA [Mycoplasmopsis anatis]MBW0596751.1 bifunctional oligoribonuclease/PAP phosphatase NrnA [Mycoplasmopsis anatis]MBW0597234.1 bifunctional oligoribonuclease/PAP phosphatase NrnA [Mycoplasmopsis anatis]MBW0599643.1 bifunctional oligoribonuclease/PAP phosphatase NrnA [Mycoplasmopsis anatis]MBW0600146.1 bifunctional oligoribonuclease/PAP phosphatase NrnA [My